MCFYILNLLFYSVVEKSYKRCEMLFELYWYVWIWMEVGDLMID